MALRTYSVIVQPNTWDGPIEDLARLVAPIAGASARDIIALLKRGPMTVESDLSETAARALERKLRAMNVYPVVRGDDGSTLNDPEANVPAMLDSMGFDDVEVDVPMTENRTLLGVGAAVPESVKQVVDELEALRQEDAPTRDFQPQAPTKIIPKETPAKTASADISGRDPFSVTLAPSALDQAPDETDVPDAMETSASGQSSGGWDALFPGISGSMDALPDTEDLASKPEPQPAPVVQPKPDLDTARTVVDTDIPAAVLAFQSTEEQDSLPARPANNASSGPPPAEKPNGTAPRRSDIEAAKASHEILGLTDKAPPYKPTGYDPRGPHSPKVAAAFSTVAPGAGQVYNGQDEYAVEYGLKFFMVRPWIDSVEDARRYAKKIEGYWAPRPVGGNVLRAVRYALLFWLCLAGLLTVVGMTTTYVYKTIARDPLPEVSAADIARCHQDAEIKVQEARIAALDALSAAITKPKKKFTMSDDERAERLFRIGYEYCEKRRYLACESTMKKVTAIKSGHRNALRLQSWSSMSRRTRKRLPLPDIGEVETLGNYELRLENEEDGTVPNPAPTEADAGAAIQDTPDQGTD